MARRSFVPFVACASLVLFATGCSSLRVKLTGDRGVRYQAAWTTKETGTTTRAGSVPATLKFEQDMTGWFQNPTASGTLRVRVYEGMGLLVDETLVNSARRVVIERKGAGVSYRLE